MGLKTTCHGLTHSIYVDIYTSKQYAYCVCIDTNTIECMIHCFRDFDVRLYLCNAAFTFLGRDTFERMSSRLVFPVYAVVHAVGLVTLIIAFVQQSRLDLINTLQNGCE